MQSTGDNKTKGYRGQAIPGLTDVAEAPAPALVAGLAGVYRTAALIIAAATLPAVVALYLDRRRSRRRMKR